LVALGLCGTLLFRAKNLFVAAIVAAFTGLAPKSANQNMTTGRSALGADEQSQPPAATEKLLWGKK
jgi:hypothetical protein